MVDNQDIDKFFGNIGTILTEESTSKQVQTIESPSPSTYTCSEEQLVKEVNDPEGTKRTNIVYLNTDCNLRCEYCYEGDSREGLQDQANCTPEQIDVFLESVYKREKGKNSNIVVMGGEPTLRLDLLEHLVTKLSTMPKKEGWAVLMTTNAILLNKEKYLNKLLNVYKICDQYSISFNVEVSYDGSGHFRRIFPDGTSSRDMVEKALDTIENLKLRYYMSYTAHTGNHDKLMEDMIYINERWPGCQRISISFAYRDLDAIGTEYAYKLKEQFYPYAVEIFKTYKTPICGVICDVCNYCDRNSQGNAYLSPTSDISYADKQTQHEFQQF